MPKLYAQKWIEYEHGCGERPDGYSLHLQAEDVAAFEEEERQQAAIRLAEAGINEPPDECKHAFGKPFEIKVSEAVYEQVKQSRFGVKFHEDWEKAAISTRCGIT